MVSEVLRLIRHYYDKGEIGEKQMNLLLHYFMRNPGASMSSAKALLADMSKQWTQRIKGKIDEKQCIVASARMIPKK